jgi:hypothetical protein
MKMKFDTQADKFLRANMAYFLVVGIVVSLVAIIISVSSQEDEARKRDLREKSHLQRIESLEKINKEQKEEIKALEEACSMREGEISYWGRMYQECRDSRINKQ